MKKIIVILAMAIAAVACGSLKKTTNVEQVNIANIPVTWDNITSSDSAFESFKLSDAEVQHDVLRSLLTEAEKRIYDVKDQDQLQVFKRKVEAIRRYYRDAKKPSVPIEHRINDLMTRISKVEE